MSPDCLRLCIMVSLICPYMGLRILIDNDKYINICNFSLIINVSDRGIPTKLT